MEILLGLIALVLAGVAMGRARKVRDRNEQLAQRLTRLETEVYLLSKAAAAAEAKAAPTPAPRPAMADIPPVQAPQPATAYPPAPAVPEMPVQPEVEASVPPEFTEPDWSAAPPPVIAPPPIPALAQAEEPRITAASTPPPLVANTEAVPPSAPQPAEKKESIEMRIGTYWTVRVGIVIILTCLAFAANLAYQNIVPRLGPAGKISLLYLASGLLLAAGAWWQRRAAKATLKNYAQVLFAGGLAAVYFTTYAAHHIAPLRVIEQAGVDGALLLAWAGVILWIADRRKSEVMALFAVGLAFYSSVITRVGDFTLYSNLVLTLAAVGFLLRNRWAGLSFAGLIMSYAGYAFWRFLHDDGWRWATPDEGLNFGAAFLAAYWLVFTVATFLSRSEKLTGPNRAAFLSLNNGAFFALFLLTMLQVRSGGFWKFSLGYGTVLLALAALARKTLPDEPLVKNTYLTQGLLLITLGFVTKFAGYQLALVLGVESVVLYLMGTQRQSVVLKCFAYAAALLATGWCVASLQPFAQRGLWTGMALGAFMAVNAWRAHWLERDPESERLETTVFALLACVSATATAWVNTLEPHLPVTLVLGVASMVLFNLVARRQSLTPKFFNYLAAMAAVGWAAINLKPFDPTGLWIGITLGTLLLFNAYWAHRDTLENETQPLRTEPALFTLLAFACWLAVTWFNSTAEHLPLVLAAEAVALTLSIYVLRLREVTLLGQLFLVLAQAAWFGHFLNTTPPWWNPLALIAVTIGLSHWWQKQKTLAVHSQFSIGCQSVCALASVGLVLAWLQPQVHAPAWLALTSLLAVAATLYGVVSRAWPLAICAQIFLAVSAWEFFAQVWTEKPDWFFPLAPVAGLAMLSLAAVGWLARRPDSAAEVREPILKVALVYRWVALVMSLSWLWQSVPARQHVGAFMAAAIGAFALAGWKRSREALVGAAVYALAALLTLWAVEDLKMDAYWLNLLALLSLLVMQQIMRQWPGRFELTEAIHGGIIGVGGLSLWRLLGCWVTTSGIFLTMSWAGFAVVFFVAGICLRERFHRWLGLGVLAAAVGRVVLVDVWKQETIYRVLTFMALGVALLVVGFIYNKYQDTIRKWL